MSRICPVCLTVHCWHDHGQPDSDSEQLPRLATRAKEQPVTMHPNLRAAFPLRYRIADRLHTLRLLWRLNRAYLNKQTIIVRADIDYYENTLGIVNPDHMFLTGTSIKGLAPIHCPTCGKAATREGERQQRFRYWDRNCDDPWHDTM